MESTDSIVSAREAARRLRADHHVLSSQIEALSAGELAAPYRLDAGPLGDFCDSLHDLIAHVLMWDEIGLAVLAEAHAGRSHWSLDPRWETREAGEQLNRAGVMAGRQLPAALLVHRLHHVRQALVDDIEAHQHLWTAPTGDSSGPVLGQLAQQAITVPGSPAYVHAALHLARVPTWLDRE